MTPPDGPYDRHDSSGFAAMPPPPDARRRGPAPPTEVRVSFWGFLLAALVVLLGGLLTIGRWRELRETARRTMAHTYAKPVSEAQLDELATATVVITVLVAVVIAGLFTLFAYKARAGRNWARIVLAIVAVLALVELVTGGSGVLGFVGRVVAVLSAVPLFLPKSNSYYALATSMR